MIEFNVLIIDYKKDYKNDSFERDEELMQQKAENICEELKKGYDIDPFVNYKKGCHGALVAIEFKSLDKDIKKIFKLIKKNEPYSIRTEWKEG